MKFLHKLWKETAFSTYLAIGGSILLGVAIIAFCITSSINNNLTQKTSVKPVQTQNIAEKHNENVEELVKDDKLLTDPTYYAETADEPVTETETVSTESGFRLSVIDVGQGLCCLIECDGERLLYDGGDRDTSSFVVSYLTKTLGIDRFDYVLASHYDSDHIAGLIGVLKTCKVGMVMGAPYVADTKTYQSFISAAEEKGGVYYPFVGDVFNVGSAECTVVCPQPDTKPYNRDDETDDENRMCLGIRVVYGNTSYLLMGDATETEENEAVDAGWIAPTDVLVVNHHGSASSSSEKFIQAVSPQVSIISCGLNNEYGHPTDIVMSRIADTLIYRTDEDGTIELESDGVNIDVYTEN